MEAFGFFLTRHYVTSPHLPEIVKRTISFWWHFRRLQVFDGVFVLSCAFQMFFFGRCRGFCYRTESDLFLFHFYWIFIRNMFSSSW